MSEQQKPDTQTPGPQELKEALDKSSSINRTLGLGFSVFIFIMALLVAATTDMDLFIPDSTFTFPLINLPLNIIYFFVAAPFVVLIMHYNLLYNLHQHSEKLLSLYKNKTDNHNETNEATNETKPDSLLMYPFLFNYALTVQNPLHGRALNLVIRTTVFILPLALLIFIFIRFADYQSTAISAWHFAAVLLDMALIATHSRSIIQVIKTSDDKVRDAYAWLDFFAFQKGKPRIKNFTLNAAKFLFRIVPRAISTTFKYLRLELAIALIAIAYFVFFVYIMNVNIGRETAHESLISYIIPRLSLPEEVLVKSQPDQQIKSLYLNTSLTLEERNQKEQELILKFTEPYILRGRCFRYADLSLTILTRSDLRDVDLTGVFLENSKMQKSRLERAELQGAELIYANFQGADLSIAKFQGANLSSAQLQEAKLFNTQLQGANLWAAKLQGANLWAADLQGANLSNGQLQGADLSYAQLQGADLSGAQLQVAVLLKSQLQGAVLSYAQLQGADLSNAQLQGAVFNETRIKGTLFIEATVDTLLIINEPDEANDIFVTDSIMGTNVLLIQDEEIASRVKNRMNEARTRFENDTLTLAEKIPNAKIYRPEDLATDSSFFFIRRRIAAQGKDIAQSMLRSISFFYWNLDAHPIYKSLYTDLYRFLKSNHPDYLVGIRLDEEGEYIPTEE